MSDKVILLGDKGWAAPPKRWAPKLAVFFGGRIRRSPLYIVDCGLGVTRQFVEAGYTLADVHTILLTHLHSDHCLELGPLLHTIWVSSEKAGDSSVLALRARSRWSINFSEVMSYDISMRMQDERQKDPLGMFLCTEFQEGLVFRDDLVEVTALRVDHPPLTRHICPEV